jgi:hypothetical protein
MLTLLPLTLTKIDPDKEDDVIVTNEYQETTDYHNINEEYP